MVCIVIIISLLLLSILVNIPTFCQLRTSANNCWNGSHIVKSDSIVFSSYDIKEQANNSAYNYDIYKFYEQV